MIPNPVHIVVNHTLLASNGPQGNPTQQAISSTTEIGPQSGLDVQATGSPVISLVMTSVVALMTPPSKNVPRPSRCWKCHLSILVSTLDDIWEASTNWRCWVFRGVDPYDDGQLDGCEHGNGFVSGDRQGSIGPRRVMLDGMPIIWRIDRGR